jgi:hypothetical protein
MTRSNPFPGMNPWLEEHWPGVHSRLIAYLADAIAVKLPDDLQSLPEEGVSISADCGDPRGFRADVAVKESWQEGESPAWNPTEDAELEARAAIPTIVQIAPMTERWIEIRDATGTLVTVIEILSPGNKTGSGWNDYVEKRQLLLESPINLVEIDLLLGGKPVIPEGFVKLPRLDGSHYSISTKRAGAATLREIHRPLLREPLPVIRIPLRKGERDVLIDLQPLVDRVHQAGRYDMLDYQRLPDLPLPPEDQQWLRGRLGD